MIGALSQIQEELRHTRYSGQLEFVNCGGFSSVVLARDNLNCGRRVALKFVSRSQVSANMSECLLQSRLHHPHVVGLHEVFLTSEHLVLVLEYVAGGDLSNAITPGVGLPESQARWFFQQIIFALNYCHRMGVAMRDVKLENCLLSDSSERPLVKLADFGLACSSDGHSTTACTSPVGTPIYWPPEMLCTPNQAYNSQAHDMWSAAVLLVILLTGRSPFQRASDMQLGKEEQALALFGRIRRLEYDMPQGLSHECQDLIRTMLVADPDQRPSTQELLFHPWLRCKGLDPVAMLHCNDYHVAASLANQQSPELLMEVLDILREACMVPAVPEARAAQAIMVHATSWADNEIL